MQVLSSLVASTREDMSDPWKDCRLCRLRSRPTATLGKLSTPLPFRPHTLTILKSWWVNVDGMTVRQEGADDVFVFGGSQTFMLSSGYTLSGFPSPIFYALLSAFPSALPIAGSNLYSVDCAVAGVEGFLDFTFGSKVINVPYADFIWQQPQTDSCYLGAFQSDSKTPLFSTRRLTARLRFMI